MFPTLGIQIFVCADDKRPLSSHFSVKCSLFCRENVLNKYSSGQQNMKGKRSTSFCLAMTTHRFEYETRLVFVFTACHSTILISFFITYKLSAGFLHEKSRFSENIKIAKFHVINQIGIMFMDFYMKFRDWC